MGGQLIKGYAIEGDSQGTAGLTRSWKLYRGKKEGTHLPASIFLIEKRQLKKSERDEAIKLAKKEASSLLRVRHPGVLAVIEPLTEDENILAFVTERVEGSLAQLMKQAKLIEHIGSQLELKLALYPFLETLSFIHDSLKQSHLALSLDNIYLTTDGKWKLAGFGANLLLAGEEAHQTEQKPHDYSFSAPEFSLNKQYSRKTDVFSVGVILIRLLEFIHKDPHPVNISDRSDYEKHQNDLKKLAHSAVISRSSNVSDLEILAKGLLEWDMQKRISVTDALNSRWMNDSTLTTVKYLDKISSYENKQQLEFLKGLAGVLEDFDLRVTTRIILPKLLDMLKFGHLIASVLFIVIDLLKKGRLTAEIFRKSIWPALKAVTQGKQMTAQAIYLFVLNLQVLEKFVGQPDTTTHLLPLYIKCFDCPPKLKHLALINLERLSRKLDYQVFKTKIIPKLIGLFKDPAIDVRKDALKGLYCVIKIIDVQTMAMNVLPGLQTARKAGTDPFVNSIINTIYNLLASSLPSQVISSKILPVLIPYLSDPSINRQEFHQFKTTIMSMISRIEKEREKNFENAQPMEETHFNEADFRFNEEENKPPQPEAKGNYNFLSNYIETKKEPEPIIASTPQIQTIQPQIISTSTIQPTIQQTITSNNTYTLPNIQIPTKQAKPVEAFSFNAPLSFTPLQMDNPIKTSLPLTTVNDKRYDSYDFNFDSLNFAEEKKTTLQPAYELPIFSSVPNPPVVASPTPVVKVEPIAQPKPIKGPPKAEPDLKKVESKKDEKPKFIGGASGPMQIKKLVGPISPAKPKQPEPPKKDTNMGFDFSYMSTTPAPAPKEQNNFQLNFPDMGNFNLSFAPSVPTPTPTFTPSFNLPSTSFNFPTSTLAASSSNPFDQIQSVKPAVGKTADIYSYFEQQKGGSSSSKGGFDLI